VLPTYTAEELARRVQDELGAEVTPRTLYYYRSIGLLSPLVMDGNQPRFSERHFLELAAILALKRAPDNPTLSDIAGMLSGLSDDGLRRVAAAIGPTSRELVAEQGPAPGPMAVSVAESLQPYSPAPHGRGSPPGRPREGAAGPSARKTSSGVTMTLAPGVTLHLGPEAPRDLVARLVELSLDYTGERSGRPERPGAPGPRRRAPDRSTGEGPCQNNTTEGTTP